MNRFLLVNFKLCRRLWITFGIHESELLLMTQSHKFHNRIYHIFISCITMSFHRHLCSITTETPDKDQDYSTTIIPISMIMKLHEFGSLVTSRLFEDRLWVQLTKQENHVHVFSLHLNQPVSWFGHFSIKTNMCILHLREQHKWLVIDRN